MTTRPFLLLVGLLTTLAIFVGVSSEASGISLGEPQNTIRLDSALCLTPCLLGIAPGHTAYSRALEIISSLVPEAQKLGSGNFWINGTENTQVYVDVRSVLPSVDNHVTSIELSTRGQGQIISLGEALDMGHTPHRVFRNRVSGPNTINLLIVFGENEQLAATVIGTERVEYDSPIISLTILSQQDREWLLDEIVEIRNYDDEISWLGFASVEEYWAAPAL